MISIPDPPRQGVNQCILVLGMHRSGTSALTRTVNLLGAHLPKNTLGADISNEKGHWELLRLVELHDALFAELNSRWDDWRSVDLNMLSAERFSYYQAEIIRIITEEFSSLELFVVKDPRICRLMPLWRSALGELRTEVRCAIPFRHPTEVARSLERRNGLPLFWGHLLWLRYILEAERQTRGLRRSFVHYNDLIEDANSVATLVASELAEDALKVSIDSASEIASFIDPVLRHQTARPEDLIGRNALSHELREAYEAYSMLARCPTDEEAQRALDEVTRALPSTEQFLSPILESLETCFRARLKTEELHKAELALGEELHKKLDSLRTEHEMKVANYETMLNDLHTSTSWRVTAPLRAVGKLTRRVKGELE